jgi:diaminohydroxyphosphoribosylaminopyrimidine deaminase / 5-amino-6-(5-phosphoribosylamino)uracil reductase
MSTAERPGAVRDVTHMRRALSLARRGWGRTAPNPMVGAVVARDDVVVGEGFHAEFGGPHAEVVALRAAGDGARGATVYVTLEPCAHHGKTPPCADALVAAGVARVVIAAADPNPTARGGAERLRAAGIDVVSGVERERACELNASFFNSFVSRRPWVVLKLALSADGAIAAASRRKQWLTGPDAQAEVHRLRAGVDAVAVGLGTALADDPALTARGDPRPRVPPARIVFDDDARLPVDRVLVHTARDLPTIVVTRRPDETRARHLEDMGVRILRASTLESALEQLARDGIRSILVEGGAGLAGRLLRSGLIDRMVIFRTPVVLGPGALHAFAHAPGVSLADADRFRLLETQAFGDDTMSVYALTPAPCSPD